MANSPALLDNTLTKARPKALTEKIPYQPLPEKLRGWFDLYEASYFDFVTKLASENPDAGPAGDALVRFRLFRRIFYHELLEFALKDRSITSLRDDNSIRTMVATARVNLFDAFPDHAMKLEKLSGVPMAYLPFIKYQEDPFSEILGQTFKITDDDSLVLVRSGSGKELATTTHEYLHSITRGLPGFFEEGFIRHSLSKAGLDDDELATLPARDKDTIRCNLNSIFYPVLVTRILAQAYGEKSVEDGFFHGPGELGAKVVLATGKGFMQLEKPFRSFHATDAVDTLMAMKKAFEHSISKSLSEAIERIAFAVESKS